MYVLRSGKENTAETSILQKLTMKDEKNRKSVIFWVIIPNQDEPAGWQY